MTLFHLLPSRLAGRPPPGRPGGRPSYQKRMNRAAISMAADVNMSKVLNLFKYVFIYLFVCLYLLLCIYIYIYISYLYMN